MSFPSNPANSQIAVVNNISYTYDSTKGVWIRTPALLTIANTINANVFNAIISFTGNVAPITSNSNTAVGYLGAPQNSILLNTRSANLYTLVLSDAGKSIYTGITANTGAIIVPSNSVVPFPIGTTIVIINPPTGNTCNIGNNNSNTLAVLYVAGNNSLRGSGANSVVLGSTGMASLIKVLPDTWYISGAGVS
jgi:hypothetical protein